MSVRPRLLRIEFSTEDSFRSEYVTNVINGGIFVVTEGSFDQNEPVRIEIVLAYSGECIELEGEVVHCIGPELAATGATPGVAVQFDLPAAEIRRLLEPECQSFESAGERSAQAGRRVSPRATARVPARLRVERSGEEFEVRTRNLSASGVLISAHRDVVPVGDSDRRLPQAYSCTPRTAGGRSSRRFGASGVLALEEAVGGGGPRSLVVEHLA